MERNANQPIGTALFARFTWRALSQRSNTPTLHLLTHQHTRTQTTHLIDQHSNPAKNVPALKPTPLPLPIVLRFKASIAVATATVTTLRSAAPIWLFPFGSTSAGSASAAIDALQLLP